MDLIQHLGELALGSRLKRLSETIMNDGVAVYQTYDLDFDPKWFPVYYALSKEEGLSITDLAARLDISHPGVIKLARGLEKSGLVDSSKDPGDGRRRILCLSEKGKALLPEMETAWQDIANALKTVVAKSGELLESVQRAEDLLRSSSLSERVRKVRAHRLMEAVEILDYQPEFGADFKRINYNWIEKYFKVEEADVQSLENHQAYIIDPGGAIILARCEGRIVGAVALIRQGPDEFELAKMGVDEDFQGRQIGKKLGLAAIAKAKELQGRRLYLESNRRLQPAIQLYRRLGFREVIKTGPSSVYERADIFMEMYL